MHFLVAHTYKTLSFKIAILQPNLLLTILLTQTWSLILRAILIILYFSSQDQLPSWCNPLKQFLTYLFPPSSLMFAAVTAHLGQHILFSTISNYQTSQLLQDYYRVVCLITKETPQYLTHRKSKTRLCFRLLLLSLTRMTFKNKTSFNTVQGRL